MYNSIKFTILHIVDIRNDMRGKTFGGGVLRIHTLAKCQQQQPTKYYITYLSYALSAEALDYPYSPPY